MSEQPHSPNAGELVKDFLGASHEILPGRLWQTSAVGSLLESLGSDKPVMVISCIESPEAPHLAAFVRFPFEDGPKLPEHMGVLRQIALAGYLWLCDGGAVIVHCLAGNNRSGLICGIVLASGYLDGIPNMTGSEIVAFIQKANPHALYNDVFRKYLEAL